MRTIGLVFDDKKKVNAKGKDKGKGKEVKKQKVPETPEEEIKPGEDEE